MDDSAFRQLTDDLASADPSVRDDGAYTKLAEALSARQLTGEQRRQLGDLMVDRFAHPQPQARSFAPLILAVLASTWTTGDGDWPTEWTDSVLEWWTTEQDLRGHVEPIGWIHAVAHGADAVGELGARGLAPVDRLLDAIAGRLTATTEFVWRDQEDDRVAAAVVGILLGTPDADVRPLLQPITAMFATGEPGPVPAAATNAVHTLRSLYVALGNVVIHPESGEGQRIPNAAELQREVAVALQPTAPWLFSAAAGSAD
ncbi:DUF2785 domain-containing protein [Flexivirga sp.]|uniref:DUF2785 domain-containing protein n=1 Tax=Flexivirga sp. TaxID=1962927 RepID=UPI003F7CF99E